MLITGANAATVNGTTDGNGVYSADVSALTAPISILVTDRSSSEVKEFRSVAPAVTANASNRANVTPITNLIVINAGTTDAAAITALADKISDALANIQNSLGIGRVDYFKVDFTANSTGMDALYDLVSVRNNEAGKLEIRNNLTRTAVAFTTTETPTPLPAISTAEAALPQQLKTLVDAVVTALNTTSKDLSTLATADFNYEGQTLSQFTAFTVSDELKALPGFRINRCETSATECVIGIPSTFKATGTDDFNATNPPPVPDTLEFLVKLEGGAFKLAGSVGRPFDVSFDFLTALETQHDSTGAQTAGPTQKTLVSLSVPVTNDPNHVNQGLKEAKLDFGAESITVVKSTACTSSSARFGLPGCGNQQTTTESNLMNVFKSGLGTLTLTKTDNSTITTPVAFFPFRPLNKTEAKGKFAELDVASIQSLHGFGFSSDNTKTATVNLKVPEGFSRVCFSDGGSMDDICVSSDRTIKVGTAQGLQQQPNFATRGYFLITKDIFGNRYQRNILISK